MYGSYRFKDRQNKEVFFEIKEDRSEPKVTADVSFTINELVVKLKADADDLHNLGHLLRKAAHTLCKVNKEPYSPPTTELDQYES